MVTGELSDLHVQFGHVSPEKIKKMIELKLIDGLPSKIISKPCLVFNQTTQQAKSYTHSFVKEIKAG